MGCYQKLGSILLLADCALEYMVGLCSIPGRTLMRFSHSIPNSQFKNMDVLHSFPDSIYSSAWMCFTVFQIVYSRIWMCFTVFQIVYSRIWMYFTVFQVVYIQMHGLHVLHNFPDSIFTYMDVLHSIAELPRQHQAYDLIPCQLI